MVEGLFEFVATDEEAGLRLDRFLAKRIPTKTRSQLQRLIEESQVQLNQKSIKASHIIKTGERISINIPPPEELELKPEVIPLDVLYEDKDIIVINKEAGRVVHPGAGVTKGTLVHALLAHCGDLSGIGGKLRPGIVHRLDKGTSGVMVIAKNDVSHLNLTRQFHDRKVEKVYYTFVWGCPSPLSGVIDQALGRSAKDRKKIAAKSSKGRPAKTFYKVLAHWSSISLLEVKPVTGRTHQIRVHLADLGHAIVGDETYGKGQKRTHNMDPEIQNRIKRYHYPLLHAGSLSFFHPTQTKWMNFKAELRDEMQDLKKLLEKLR